MSMFNISVIICQIKLLIGTCYILLLLFNFEELCRIWDVSVGDYYTIKMIE